jgi:hypothetical protein
MIVIGSSSSAAGRAGAAIDVPSWQFVRLATAGFWLVEDFFDLTN